MAEEGTVKGGSGVDGGRGGGSKLIRASKRVQLTNEPTPSLVPTSAATPCNPLPVSFLSSSRCSACRSRRSRRRRRHYRLAPCSSGYCRYRGTLESSLVAPRHAARRVLCACSTVRTQSVRIHTWRNGSICIEGRRYLHRFPGRNRFTGTVKCERALMAT